VELLAVLPLATVAVKRRRELEAQRKTATATPPMRLLEYIQQAWHIVEPATAYVHGFHIEAIAERLEACSRGEIQDLVITPAAHREVAVHQCVLADLVVDLRAGQSLGVQQLRAGPERA
jgi:hypothetical protein